MLEAESATATRPYTAEEYFELEKRLEECHEFVCEKIELVVVPTASIRHTNEVKDAELIIEVDSEDSYNRDHKAKPKEYTEHFPTLRYYLIVNQYEPLVAVYSRQNANEKWSYETFGHLEDEISLDFFLGKTSPSHHSQKITFGEAKAN
ncbi:MAG: Uma2 family endonuclease [Saprospiraceae bacterium]|nr:Uma2 family endonuclease [Saprospiraceae bacterium]